jgi:hypothetical protein
MDRDAISLTVKAGVRASGVGCATRGGPRERKHKPQG